MAKILLIDDTVFFRKMYADILSASGYEILEASDGLEGIQKAREVQPDLILLDMAMPKLNGLMALEKLKADTLTSSIKVIVLSSKDTVNDIKEALQQGAEDYLIKTENKPVEVVEKIKSVLQNTATVETAQTAERPEFTRLAKKYTIYLRDREGDADDLTSDCSLTQRFWCPKCQEELVLELTPDSGLSPDPGKHRFKARFICSKCGEEF